MGRDHSPVKSVHFAKSQWHGLCRLWANESGNHQQNGGLIMVMQMHSLLRVDSDSGC
jgi:hypothetical protein